MTQNPLPYSFRMLDAGLSAESQGNKTEPTYLVITKHQVFGRLTDGNYNRCTAKNW